MTADHSAQRIIVIGGGPAGVFAAIEAKRRDASAEVTLISDEPCEPYERPPLSKAVLLGKALAEDAPIAGPKGLAGHGVSLSAATTVAEIDRAAREIVTGDGRRLPYDALVLATGARAREIAALPLGMKRVHYLRTEAQARALKSELATARQLVVIGAGLIGLEVTASAAELGVKTTVLEMAPRILARVCDADTGSRIHATHSLHGVDIRVATTLDGVAVKPNGQIAIATDGEVLMADVVVVGAGAVPDTDVAARAGLTIDQGILVDAQCRSSDPNIFAAGDAVRFPGPRGLIRLEDWRHAQDQGGIAGRNAAGGNDTYRSTPSFWSEQYDLYIQGVGWPSPEAPRIRRDLANGTLAFEIADGRIVAAIGINAQRDIATVRRLIERAIPVDAAALADPARPLTDLLKIKTT